MDKMTIRIRVWYARNLSYTARLQLITFVLMGITSYWCQLFILPKVIIKRVNAICCSYLWFGVHNNDAIGKVNWNHVCRPKNVGGLGIRNLEVWNIAAVGKLAWHISSLQESLWVRWIYEVYTKGASWAIFNPPPTTSWALRKLCGIKDKLSRFISLTTYSIQEVYKDCLDLGQPVRSLGMA